MGRAFSVALDRTDLGKAIAEAGAAMQKVERLGSPENSDLRPSERRAAMREALSHAHLAARFLDGVLDRNDYEP